MHRIIDVGQYFVEAHSFLYLFAYSNPFYPFGDWWKIGTKTARSQRDDRKKRARAREKASAATTFKPFNRSLSIGVDVGVGLALVFWPSPYRDAVVAVVRFSCVLYRFAMINLIFIRIQEDALMCVCYVERKRNPRRPRFVAPVRSIIVQFSEEINHGRKNRSFEELHRADSSDKCSIVKGKHSSMGKPLTTLLFDHECKSVFFSL